MQQNIRVFVGLDTSKMKISVALAEDGRQGEVRFLGDINNTPDAVKRLVIKLTGKYQKLLFCYEPGRLAMACIARSPLSGMIVPSSHLP
jgi:transposase